MGLGSNDFLSTILDKINAAVIPKHIGVGILFAAAGFLAGQIHPSLGLLCFGLAILLLTWQIRLWPALRAFFYFLTVTPALYWVEQASTALFPHAKGQADLTSTAELIYRYGFAAAAIAGLLIVVLHRVGGKGPVYAGQGADQWQTDKRSKEKWKNIPKVTFKDLGGMQDVKRRISLIVENRLHPERSAKHGVVQNGILLYGPRGTGKTAIGEATAGEFRINYWYINPNQFIESRVGSSEANIRDTFAEAHRRRPILLFVDELDAIGTQRQQLGRNDDVGGAARGYNAIVTELMQCIDRYRREPGFIIMAATNFYDALDEALIREMRFDEKIRVDLPDESARAEILIAQLSKRPWVPFDANKLAKKTNGWSAAKLTNLVNKAASCAAAENRRIEERDVLAAFNETGGRDRPTLKPIAWEDLVLPPAVESDLRLLVRMMDSNRSEGVRGTTPTGLLLVGPPGTGKTSVAQLIATQTRRSFYSMTPADVPTPQRLDQIFARAKENSPSMLFIDEMDGILPGGANNRYVSQHQQQIVEQALILMSQLDPTNQVFLVGTTNHIDEIDPRVLRGGRFSEKIELTIPDDAGYLKLIQRFLEPNTLAKEFSPQDLLERIRGISPADLQAVTNTALRMALIRVDIYADKVPPLVWDDFDKALKRNRVHFSNLRR